MGSARWARYEAQHAVSAAEYEAWRRDQWEKAAAWNLYYAGQEIERLRRVARTQKSEYDQHVNRLTERIVTLSKSIEEAEEAQRQMLKIERKRRALETETAQRIGSVEKATLLVATAVTKQAIEKAAPKIKRKRVIRDAKNRITEVIEEEVEV